MTNPKITVPDFTFTTLREDATMPEAYQLAMAADSVDQKVKGAQSNVYDIMRYHAVKIYREELIRAKDVVTDMDLDVVAGAFLSQCDIAERSVPGTMPDAWKYAKSRFNSAINKGLNLQENSSMAQSKLATWLKEHKKAEDDKKIADQQAKAGNVTDINKNAERKNVPDNNGNADSGTGSPENQPAPINSELSGLSAEVKATLEELIAIAKGIESGGTGKQKKTLINSLNMIAGQLKPHQAAALAKLKAAV